MKTAACATLYTDTTKARQALIHSSNKESQKMALKTGCKIFLLTYQDRGNTAALIYYYNCGGALTGGLLFFQYLSL